jgi:tripartite-type tricarboxylate transporter receptor subunit TctC
MLAPAATPKTIINTLYAETAKALKEPQVESRFIAQGLEVHATTPVEFSKYLDGEISRWGKVIQAAGVRAE